MIDTAARARELVDLLTAAGVRATADVRNVNPPCVLVTPPRLAYDLMHGASAEWQLVCLAPAPANLDAWQALDRLEGAVVDVVDVETSEPRGYTLDDTGPLPARILTTTEGLST